MDSTMTSAQFFAFVRNDNWLFPELGAKCVRVDSFSFEHDIGPIHGISAYLSTREHTSDVISNLATIDRIRQSFGKTMMPLPTVVKPYYTRPDYEVAISGVSWHATFHDTQSKNANVFVHLYACYRHTKRKK
jgi:hypothetical protein